MPIHETTTLTIICDNAACPGHPDLNPGDRTGWLFVGAEWYGEPAFAVVVGSYECLAAAAMAAAPRP
jgi:hypothetical protein